MSEPAHGQRTTFRRSAAVAVLAGGLILLVAVEWGSWGGPRPRNHPAVARGGPPPLAPAARATPGVTGGPTPVRAFNAARIPPPAADSLSGRSPLADGLNDPGRTASDDVAIVAELFANYLEVFRKLPVGTNPEITAALAGDNPRGHAPLPADHPAINAGGELVDRWGTPYFFHHVSRESMEIRAAGPDRRHFTPDDVTWPPAEAVAAGPAAIGAVRSSAPEAEPQTGI